MKATIDRQWKSAAGNRWEVSFRLRSYDITCLVSAFLSSTHPWQSVPQLLHIEVEWHNQNAQDGYKCQSQIVPFRSTFRGNTYLVSPVLIETTGVTSTPCSSTDLENETVANIRTIIIHAFAMARCCPGQILEYASQITTMVIIRCKDCGNVPSTKSKGPDWRRLTCASIRGRYVTIRVKAFWVCIDRLVTAHSIGISDNGCSDKLVDDHRRLVGVLIPCWLINSAAAWCSVEAHLLEWRFRCKYHLMMLYGVRPVELWDSICRSCLAPRSRSQIEEKVYLSTSSTMFSMWGKLSLSSNVGSRSLPMTVSSSFHAFAWVSG